MRELPRSHHLCLAFAASASGVVALSLATLAAAGDAGAGARLQYDSSDSGTPKENASPAQPRAAATAQPQVEEAAGSAGPSGAVASAATMPPREIDEARFRRLPKPAKNRTTPLRSRLSKTPTPMHYAGAAAIRAKTQPLRVLTRGDLSIVSNVPAELAKGQAVQRPTTPAELAAAPARSAERRPVQEVRGPAPKTADSDAIRKTNLDDKVTKPANWSWLWLLSGLAGALLVPIGLLLTRGSRASGAKASVRHS